MKAVLTVNCDNSEKAYYWLAINGASCAASGVLPLPVTLEVSPVPEQLIGFPTREEQREWQQFLLTAPIPACAERMQSLAKRKDVAYIRPRKPEPPQEQTLWMAKPLGRSEG